MSRDGWLRSAVLAAAGRPRVRAFFEAYGMRIGVARFVAAETLEGALEAADRLNSQGLLVTLDYLGESVADRTSAEAAAEQAVLALRGIAERGLAANVSVKLTQFGLLFDPGCCEELMTRILDEAERTDNFVRIDMEDSSVTGRTLELFERLLDRYGTRRVGAVLQSYLYRTAGDRERLGRLGANLRIVKGAYKEPKEVAFPNKRDVDGNYVRLVKAHLRQGAYTAVATHDERIVEETLRFVRERKIGRDRYEFQMLYGIASSLQSRLVRQGFRVRVYTPFGEAWYPYFMRRLAERPANLWFAAKNFFRK